MPLKLPALCLQLLPWQEQIIRDLFGIKICMLGVVQNAVVRREQINVDIDDAFLHLIFNIINKADAVPLVPRTLFRWPWDTNAQVWGRFGRDFEISMCPWAPSIGLVTTLMFHQTAPYLHFMRRPAHANYT